MKLNKNDRLFILFYILIVITELVSANGTAFTAVHFIAKPAIVSSLIIYFISQFRWKNNAIRNYTLAALIFSLIGDILLMLVDKDPLFFTLGLAAFLMAHIMYVFTFLKHRNKAIKPYGIIGVLIIYAIGLFYLLYDGLGQMLIPVVAYMTVILTMSITAFMRKGSVNTFSYKLVVIGAILFMISDSILALNKFYTPLFHANISIMLTYAMAQYFIVLGILKLKL